MIPQETLDSLDHVLRQVPRLVDAGADPSFVVELWLLVTEPPERLRLAASRKAGVDLEWQAAVREFLELTKVWTRYSALSRDPDFADDFFLVHHARQKLRELAGRCLTVIERCCHLNEQMMAANPLLDFLKHLHRPPRGQGRPPDPKITLWMVLLATHLKERTGRPSYQVVGEVTRALFPDALQVADAHKLGQAVKSRVMRFQQAARRGKDNGPLDPAVISKPVGCDEIDEGTKIGDILLPLTLYGRYGKE